MNDLLRRIVATLLILLSATVADAQQTCDTKTIQKLEREYAKANGRVARHGGAEIAHNLSECYLGVNDSLHMTWLHKAIESRKKYYPDMNMSEKISVIRDVGLWYAELGELEQAENWTLKWTKAECDAPEPYYHHGLALLALGREDEARAELAVAKKKGSVRPDLDRSLVPTFASLVGKWSLHEHWLDSELIFDADVQQVMLDYNFSKAKSLPIGAPLPDSAAVIERVGRIFEALKKFQVNISPDGSYWMSALERSRGEQRFRAEPDRGNIALDALGWTLVQTSPRPDRIPFHVLNDELVIIWANGPRIEMRFRKDP